jgi:hypothetical protein
MGGQPESLLQSGCAVNIIKKTILLEGIWKILYNINKKVQKDMKIVYHQHELQQAIRK